MFSRFINGGLPQRYRFMAYDGADCILRPLAGQSLIQPNVQVITVREE